MTVIKYLMSTSVCTTGELLALKREHPADYNELIDISKKEMVLKEIPIDTTPTK